MSNPVKIHADMSRLLSIKFEINHALDPGVQRDGWDSYGKAFKQPYPLMMQVDNSEIPRDDASTIPVRIYRPKDALPASPAILYFHGGGFVKGDLDSSDVIAWGIAEQCAAVVISVDYRLAPEHPFPAAIEDAWCALKYLQQQAELTGIDQHRIAVWGDSAGATIAAALCLLARDREGPAIVAQALNYPCLNNDLDTDSYSRFANGPGLTSKDMHYYWKQYLGITPAAADGYAAPLKATDLGKLPAAHVHIAEIDPLADDGREYAARLQQAGNLCELRIAHGMIHGYLRARFDGSDAAAEFAAPCQFLRRFLFDQA